MLEALVCCSNIDKLQLSTLTFSNELVSFFLSWNYLFRTCRFNRANPAYVFMLFLLDVRKLINLPSHRFPSYAQKDRIDDLLNRIGFPLALSLALILFPFQLIDIEWILLMDPWRSSPRIIQTDQGIWPTDVDREETNGSSIFASYLCCCSVVWNSDRASSEALRPEASRGQKTSDVHFSTFNR